MGNEKKMMEIKLLEAWKRAGFVQIYRYKSRISGRTSVDSTTKFELLYDIEGTYFKELEDLANDSRLYINDVAMSPQALLNNRTKQLSKEETLDQQLRQSTKRALRLARKWMKRYNGAEGVVLIEWYAHKATYFETKKAATDYILKQMKEWDHVQEGEDSELEVIVFCSETMKQSHAPAFEHYRPFCKADGVQYYRHRRPVKYEAYTEYHPSF